MYTYQYILVLTRSDVSLFPKNSGPWKTHSWVVGCFFREGSLEGSSQLVYEVKITLMYKPWSSAIWTFGSNNPRGFMITVVAATTYEPSWDDPPSGLASKGFHPRHCKVLEIANGSRKESVTEPRFVRVSHGTAIFSIDLPYKLSKR